MKEQELRAVHAHACAAVTKVDRTLTPDVDAFWLHYLPAAINAALSARVSEAAAGEPVGEVKQKGSHVWFEINGANLSDLVGAKLYFTAPPAASGQKLTYPDDFTDDLQWILGLMCFQCISYAQALRKGGRAIATKAEAEQAATLDYLLRRYLRDPENWRDTAVAELRAMSSDSATASDKEGA